jgi:hypothetical protein
MRLHCALCVGMFVLMTGAVFAAGDPAVTDASKAGPDFSVQGEYEGSLGNMKAGVQIIALGDGKFDAVIYPGGLPGAGWDGKTKHRLKGATSGLVTRLEGEGFDLEVNGQNISGSAGDRKTSFNRVERKSPTLEATAPEGATILFDGTSVDAWQNGKLVDDKFLGVGTRTKETFTDFTLHLEFRTPYMEKSRGQSRGNSGMYLLDQYECQILDSFGLEGKNNECGGFYQVAEPKVNMCLPPLSWQTYDVEFKAARFDTDGKKLSPAVATIKHNGVVIHDKLELPKATPGGGRNDEKEGALYIQNHGDPVMLRNIWIVKK